MQGEGKLTEALDFTEEVTARAQAMGLGLVAYQVEDIDLLCKTLRRLTRPTLVSEPPDADR